MRSKNIVLSVCACTFVFVFLCMCLCTSVSGVERQVHALVVVVSLDNKLLKTLIFALRMSNVFYSLQGLCTSRSNGVGTIQP